MSEQTYIQQSLITHTAIAQTLDNVAALLEAWYKRGYAPGGPMEITDADLADTGLTAAQFLAGVVLWQQLAALRGGQAITPGDYAATIATLRQDI